jgi:hypothetical protein
MKILIQIATSTQFQLEIQPKDELVDMKRKIQELTAIPPDEQRLKYGKHKRRIKTMKDIRRLEHKRSPHIPFLYVDRRHRTLNRSSWSGFCQSIAMSISYVNIGVIFPVAFPY